MVALIRLSVVATDKAQEQGQQCSSAGTAAGVVCRNAGWNLDSGLEPRLVQQLLLPPAFVAVVDH